MSADPPTLHYRSTPTGSHTEAFERHDALRAPTVQRIGTSVDDLIDDLHLSIALHAVDAVFVHAGVVAWNDRAIVLPGRSHAGKSTLVHALVRAGATYLSDEYARVTTSGDIAPYPRPLQLRTAGGRTFLDPSTIGQVADRPFRPGLVVFTHHRATSRFEPVSVPPAQSALELFDNTVIAEVAPLRAAEAVAQIARSSAAVRSDRGEADLAASAILTLADTMEVAS